jgi:hypothetical protein
LSGIDDSIAPSITHRTTLRIGRGSRADEAILTTGLRQHVGNEGTSRHEEALVDTTMKVKENRARRAAQRQGLALQRSRRRDRRAADYGRYSIYDGAEVLFEGTLDEAEHWLNYDSPGALRARGEKEDAQ